MTACQVLREDADMAYSQLTGSLEGVSEGLAWATLPLAPEAWLNTNATVIGMTQHIAVCKFMYGSTAFRDTEVRWRDCMARLEAIGVNWEANYAYLAEAHTY